MNRRFARAGLGVALMLSVLGLCLFGDCAVLKRSQVLGPVVTEMSGVLSDPGTQWMVFLCAGIYLLGFVILRIRLDGTYSGRDGNSPAWGAVLLAGFMVVAGAAYASSYAEAARSTHALTLVGAAMIGQGAGFWESRKQKAESRNGDGGGPKSKVQSPKSITGVVIGALILLLAVAAVWQGEAGHLFQYRGQGRWCGPWENPNTFGVLMGAGAILAIGLGVLSLKSKVQSQLSAECGARSAEHPTSNIQHRTSNCGWWVRRVLLLAAAGVMGVGLVKSYSRGAWVGTAVGMVYLLLNAEGRMKNEEKGTRKAESRKQKAETSGGNAEKLKTEMLKAVRRWGALALIAASLGVLGFWGFRGTERAVGRRAVSAANANDFSWRNRVAAWEGALQVIGEKPWFGFGWNQPERVYDRYYRAAKVNEGMAIQLNDYFALGATLGLPALLCFAMYVGLSLRGSPKPKVQSPKSATGSAGRVLGSSELAKHDGAVATEYRIPITDYWLKTTCRAGAIVLLVGFWFDGGLFKLATAAPFWILLELGRADDHETHEIHENA